MVKGNIPFHVGLRKLIRTRPHYPRELKKKLKIKYDSTLYATLHRMEDDWEEIQKLKDGRYAASDYEPLEEKITTAITSLREKHNMPPSIDDIAVEVGVNPKDKKFLKAFYKVAKVAGWESKKQWESKFIQVSK